MKIPPQNSGQLSTSSSPTDTSITESSPTAEATADGLRNCLSELRIFLPDVLGLQEVDQNQVRSSSVNQTELIAEELGAPYWAFSPTLMGTPGESWRELNDRDRRIFAHDSDRKNENIPASYGIALISKLPVHQWHYLSLKKSPLGFPIAVPGEKRPRLIYLDDEPRAALAAELENGWTIATTHLSFVPFYNAIQMRRVIEWLNTLPGKKILIGDMNMPWGLAQKVSRWQSFNSQPTYPSWKPSLQFDYILSNDLKNRNTTSKVHDFTGVSDHRALSIEFDL
jgi:endonuclease/exonuclease/phosphatase family metal-dependent hydrolase